MIERYLLILPLLWAQVCSAAPLCPPPLQPTLGQTLAQMNAAGRGGDVIVCIRSIVAENELGEMSDDLRYQLALQMSDAMHSRYGKRVPSVRNVRDAASLWEAYLKNASLPLDSSRLNFGIGKLTQLGRYEAFSERLPSIIVGIEKVGASIDKKQSDLIFSTLKRCPDWSQVSDRMTCTSECNAVVDSALAGLEAIFGDLPWSLSPGISRLSANALALKEEKLECEKSL